MPVGINLAPSALSTRGGPDPAVVQALLVIVQAGQVAIGNGDAPSVGGKNPKSAAGSEGHRYRAALAEQHGVAVKSIVRDVKTWTEVLSTTIADADLTTADGKPLPADASDKDRAAARDRAVRALLGLPAGIKSDAEDAYIWALQPSAAAEVEA